MTGYSFSNFSFYSWKLLLSQLQFSPLSFTSLHKFPLNLLLTESSNGLTGNSIGWFFTVFDREVDQEPGETTDPEAKKRESSRWETVWNLSWARLTASENKTQNSAEESNRIQSLWCIIHKSQDAIQNDLA